MQRYIYKCSSYDSVLCAMVRSTGWSGAGSHKIKFNAFWSYRPGVDHAICPTITRVYRAGIVRRPAPRCRWRSRRGRWAHMSLSHRPCRSRGRPAARRHVGSCWHFLYYLFCAVAYPKYSRSDLIKTFYKNDRCILRTGGYGDAMRSIGCIIAA